MSSEMVPKGEGREQTGRRESSAKEGGGEFPMHE